MPLEAIAIMTGIITAGLIVMVVFCILHHLDQKEHERHLDDIKQQVDRLRL